MKGCLVIEVSAWLEVQKIISALKAERDDALAKLSAVEQANRMARDLLSQMTGERDVALAAVRELHAALKDALQTVPIRQFIRSAQWLDIFYKYRPLVERK